ncbi:MAG: hypothetical protein ACTHNN_17765 [Xanthobacteraceae bacterium]
MALKQPARHRMVHDKLTGKPVVCNAQRSLSIAFACVCHRTATVQSRTDVCEMFGVCVIRATSQRFAMFSRG